jgi:trimethylamine--corrinoid protein Co-methyltransferase
MAMKGFRRTFKPLEILNEERIEEIHRGTLTVLERTGIRIEHKRTLKLLKENGCSLDSRNMRVRFPAGLVEECLRKAPSCFMVKARDPKNDLLVGGNTTYFGSEPGTKTVDLATWEPREATEKEFFDGLTVLDALPNIHFLTSFTPYFGYKGVPQDMIMLVTCAAKIRHSTKCQTVGYSNNSELFTIQMAQALGIDMICTVTPSPPLTLYDDALEACFRYAEAGLPCRVLSGAVYGASGPATIAGSTLTNNAEVLAGLVILQLIRPGLRVVIKDMAFPQNMKTGAPAFGNIGCCLHGSIFSQLCRRYEVPSEFGSAYPNAKTPDYQCGYEKALSAFNAAISGSHMQFLAGGLYGQITHHPVQSILDNDLAGIVGRFLEGVDVNHETLALDLIDEVGPIPGEYLTSSHTRQWWRREQYMPEAADSLPYPEWIRTGKKGCVDYAKERLEQILATHEPVPLTPEADAEIERILDEARKYYKLQ